MDAEQLRRAVTVFAKIPDFRHNRGLNHSAVMSGADTFPEIQAFGEDKRAWLQTFLSFRRVPDHDTFRRVFARINPVHFQSSALDWVRQAISGRLQDGDILSIDGKRLRGTSEHELQGIHMVNVWSARQQLCLSATAVAVDGKGNENTTLPSVLDTLALLEVQGCIVTIDAMGTQHEVARQIFSLKANYLLALKKNQPTLFDDVEMMFQDAQRRPLADTALDWVKTAKREHGREEERTCWMLPAPLELEHHDWPGLQSVAMVRNVRTIKGKSQQEDRYFLSSLPVDAKATLEVVRTHWHVENKLHWVLDVAFREDANRTVKDHGAENLAVLRRLSLNLIRQEKSLGGVSKNRKRAKYILANISGFRKQRSIPTFPPGRTSVLSRSTR